MERIQVNLTPNSIETEESFLRRIQLKKQRAEMNQAGTGLAIKPFFLIPPYLDNFVPIETISSEHRIIIRPQNKLVTGLAQLGSCPPVGTQVSAWIPSISQASLEFPPPDLSIPSGLINSFSRLLGSIRYQNESRTIFIHTVQYISKYPKADVSYWLWRDANGQLSDGTGVSLIPSSEADPSVIEAYGGCYKSFVYPTFNHAVFCKEDIAASIATNAPMTELLDIADDIVFEGDE